MKIKLVKSLNGRLKKQLLTAKALGLRKIGDVTEQPDNPATKGKIRVISHLVQVTE
jgi:large subunit ribosomal protein L30